MSRVAQNNGRVTWVEGCLDQLRKGGLAVKHADGCSSCTPEGLGFTSVPSEVVCVPVVYRAAALQGYTDLAASFPSKFLQPVKLLHATPALY